MNAPKQHAHKNLGRNGKKAVLSVATALLNGKKTHAVDKKAHGNIRLTKNSPLCGVTKTDLAASDPSHQCTSVTCAPTSKQRTVSPADSVNEIINPTSEPTLPTLGELIDKQRAGMPAKSVYHGLNIEAVSPSLKKNKDKRPVPAESSARDPPDVWQQLDDSRPRTASPKKDRTMPTPVVPRPLNVRESTTAKKTPKKRNLADRLTAFGPKVVSVGLAEVTDGISKHGQKRSLSPARESIASDSSNAGSTDSSPAKTKKKRNKHKAIELKTIFKEPSILSRKLETLSKAVPLKIINLKNVKKLEPVLEEEPVKKLKKAKKSKAVTEDNGNVSHKTSLRKSNDMQETTKQKNRNKRKTSLIDSPKSLETGSVVVKHTSTTDKVLRLNSELTENKYPLLKDEELISKFRGVAISNNQKGRIRQVLKEVFQGTDTAVLPDVIHNKIQTILKSSENLTDTDLRKIRVLHNMLNLAVKAQKSDILEDGEGTKKDSSVTETQDNTSKEGTEKKEKSKKAKDPKRYVVFVGNLPPGIVKETILDHFSDIKNYIRDVRIPKRGEDKKSSIAYVELMNQYTYEMALSKHHSMLGSKRINVLFTTQKNSKMSKAEAKGKTAKLVAMVRSGQLAGSVALKKKRSQRRAKLRMARKQMEAKE